MIKIIRIKVWANIPNTVIHPLYGHSLRVFLVSFDTFQRLLIESNLRMNRSIVMNDP